MTETINNTIDLLQDGFSEFIAQLPAVLLGIIVFYIIYRLSSYVNKLIVNLVNRTSASKNLEIVIGRLVRWVVVLGGFLLGAMIALPGFSPAQLISLLGIGSVAIGFAFRDILQNFLAGILILLTRPFKIGDQIIAKGFEGTVEDIQLRATYLKTYDNRRAVIPNSDLFTDSVLVNTAFNKRRSQYDVGIGYGDNIEVAQELCLQIMRETEGVLDSPAPDTIMTEMGDSAVVFRVRWWTAPHQANVLRVQNLVLRSIKNRLTEEGFDIPFPIRTVYMHNETQSDA